MSVNNFASIQVSLASPERIHERNRKQSIIVPKSQNVMDYSASASLVQARIGSVIAGNIRKCAIKALSVIDVV